MKKVVSILIAIIVVVGVAWWVIAASGLPSEELVGGERDKHGCLGAAGYQYDRKIKACVRDWELKTEDMRQAAKEAVKEAPEHEWKPTVVGVVMGECDGCADVVFEVGEERERYEVELDAWSVVETIEDSGIEGLLVSIRDESLAGFTLPEAAEFDWHVIDSDPLVVEGFVMSGGVMHESVKDRVIEILEDRGFVKDEVNMFMGTTADAYGYLGDGVRCLIESAYVPEGNEGEEAVSGMIDIKVYCGEL